MTTALYDLTAPVFMRGLRNLSALLEKGRAHTIATGTDPESLLTLRLADDMHPLSKQVQIASDTPKLCLARLSGIAAPVMEDAETTLDQLQARIQATLDYLESVPREAVDGQEEREVILTFPGGEMKFQGAAYVVGFAHPNFYFHLTTVYALLRMHGVPLGKRDFLGAR